MQYLSELDKHREEWKKYLFKMGATSHVEDIIQEMYLRTVQYNLESKVIKPNGDVNKTYIWYILRTAWMEYLKESGKVSKVELDSVLPMLSSEDYDVSREQAIDIFTDKIYASIENLDSEGYPYNKELFTTYVESGLSMRKLSAETGISTASIFNTLKKCKDQLKNELGEDYEDILNKEYELIKKGY